MVVNVLLFVIASFCRLTGFIFMMPLKKGGGREQAHVRVDKYKTKAKGRGNSIIIIIKYRQDKPIAKGGNP